MNPRATPPSLSVTIRLCTQSDLRALEWDGLFSEQREIIESAFERQLAGTNIMLVAELEEQLVGQIWIDLTDARDRGALLWAFRVHPALQGCGIGTELLNAAERWLAARDFCTVAIGVEQGNESAKRLYDRLGYTVVGPIVESYDFTTPAGSSMEVTVHLWLMEKRLLISGIAQ